MKRIVISLFLLLIFFFSFPPDSHAQRCATTEYMRDIMKKNPQLQPQFNEAEAIIQKYIAEHQNNASMRDIVTIPVVVHVVYASPDENISDTQVLSQIQVLNEDYNRTNADTVNTPDEFKSVAAACEVQFCLATRDPDGNPTTGIERVSTISGAFDYYDDGVKFSATGGADAWDVDRYLNIWCCNLVSGLFGYGQFPTGNLNDTYGVVIDYKSFGRTGVVVPPYDKGRTGSHEIGHCFSLYHISGDDGNACTGSDQVDDTPNQSDLTQGCPNFPHVSCSNGPDGDMFMNFMDYTDDDCTNMLTQGQKERMHAAINSFLTSLLTSDACIPFSQVDAGISGNATVEVCMADYSPIVVLKNYGTDPLVSCTITYAVDAGSPTVYGWNGNLATNEADTVLLPAVPVTTGDHEFTATVSNPNGGTDMYAGDDSYSATFNVDLNGTLLPLEEEFSGADFPPENWDVYNADGNKTWVKSNLGYLSSNSTYVNNYNYNNVGGVDDLFLPHLNLSSVSDPTLTFYLAYQLYTDPTLPETHSDTLEILISTDCGFTWTTVYKKFSTALVTVVPTWSHAKFIPNDPAEWRLETVDLTPYKTLTNVMIKFRNITNFENDLFVDKINLGGPVGISAYHDDAPGFELFPNPSSGGVHIYFNKPVNEGIKLTVTDALGRIMKMMEGSFGKEATLDLSDLADGIYYVTMNSPEGTMVKKVDLIK